MSLILSGTDGLSDVDGTAATPAIRGTDTNTGIFFPAADTVAASVGGTEGLRLTSTGLGVGTSTPFSKLDVKFATDKHAILTASASYSNSADLIAVNDAGSEVALGLGGSTVRFYTGTTERARLDSSGNLGIGTSSPGQKLDVVGTVRSASATQSAFYLSNAARTNGFLLGRSLGSDDSQNFFIYDTVAAATRLYLDSSGNLGIGTASPNTRLTISSSGANGINLSADTGATTNSGRLFFSNGTAGSSFSILNVGGTLQFCSAATPGADTGTARLNLDSSGNLGLGVTPSAWGGSYKAIQFASGAIAGFSTTALDIYGNAYDSGAGAWKYLNSSQGATRYAAFNGQHQFYTAPSGTAGNAISFTQAMTLDASGNLGIGVTSPAARLDLITSSQIISQLYSSNANGGYMTLGRSAAPAIIGSYSAASGGGSALNADALYFRNANGIGFGLSGNVGMTLDTSGNLLVGKTALGASTGFSVDANFGSGASGVRVVNSVSTGASDGFQMYSTGAGAFRFFVTFGGTINATSTTIAAISDQRLKENIQDLDVGLDKIMALKPRKFDWKAGKGKDIKGDRGWIAQEFEQVFPDMIDEWRDPAPEGEEPYKSVRADLIPVLVKAIQEQQAIIESLTARITALEAK